MRQKKQTIKSERKQTRGKRDGWWHEEEDWRNRLFLYLACGFTHRLQARWWSWLACFVQKQQRPRQCRIRPYRNPHSLKPGPHPHSLQQSDTQPQPTALDTPGRGGRGGAQGETRFRWHLQITFSLTPLLVDRPCCIITMKMVQSPYGRLIWTLTQTAMSA